MIAYFTRFTLEMTLAQARSVSHSGSCDADVADLVELPTMARKLSKLDPADIAAELAEYGAWDSDELADHDQNLHRLVWVAGCDIAEEHAK